MKLNFLVFCLALLLSVSVSATAQSKYSIPACKPGSKSKLGGRLKLSLPKGAIVRKGQDDEHEDYSVGFGKEEHRQWLSGFYGPLASSGRAPKDWIASSSKVSQRIWRFRHQEGADAKGRLANGNYWRYFGQYGESIRYYDVPANAAAYFDKIIDSVCFLAGQ